MSKEKTRAELSAEIKELKEYIETRGAAYEALMKDDKELGEKYDALEKDRDSQHELAMEWQRKWSVLYDDREALEKSLNNANKVIADRDAEIERLKKREEYLEGELKEKTELNEKQGERIQNYSESIERIRADRDKAQYIAADLLEHGIFHFLVVKYRNLRAK